MVCENRHFDEASTNPCSRAALRIEVGTAALLAVAAVLAPGVGTVLRRSAGAVRPAVRPLAAAWIR